MSIQLFIVGSMNWVNFRRKVVENVILILRQDEKIEEKPEDEFNKLKVYDISRCLMLLDVNSKT